MNAALPLLLLTLFLFSGCSAFEVSPESPQPGDVLTISGSASPEEEVVLRSSFSMQLPVSSGQYEYQSRVEIPQKPNRFAVTAHNVQDMNLGVKMGIWITKGFSARSGTASVSQADVPPGRYELKIFGQALPGRSQVEVDVSAQTAVKADSAGKYRLEIDTTGIPAGDYRIEIAGQSETVRLESSAYRDSSQRPDSSRRELQEFSAPTSTKREITPEVIAWYAEQIDLEPNDQEQYLQAEEQLRARVKGDYWRVIARGDPLTEQAGDCQQDYCLVRGIDACTICREKEMLTREQPPENGIAVNSSTAPEQENLSSTRLYAGDTSLGENKGFISRIVDWIKGMLSRLNGE